VRDLLRHALAPVRASAAAALGVPRTVPAAGVALTFDDGPHPEGTPAILEILASHAAVATFFVVGERVRSHPELARRILAEGHALALHGDRHVLQLRRTERDLDDDYARGAAAIEEATGRRPARHRPPYGIYSAAGLRLARERGMAPLLWSSWGKDWRRFTTPDRIARRALAGVGAGDVILLHDADFYSAAGSHRRTIRALPEVLSELKRRGLDTVLPV
jgi:peptidoglycan/xylan/chitin deacetylase (PgdA/CDA1 family)